MDVQSVRISDDAFGSSDDYELDDRECLKCGYSPTHSRRCIECGGEGGFDCYDEDPINFYPGEQIDPCEVCSESGIEHWCPNCGADQAAMRFWRDYRPVSQVQETTELTTELL